MEKKKYIHPVIKRIKLDPEQAILVACKVGGVFMSTASIGSIQGCAFIGEGSIVCDDGNRGAASAYNLAGSPADAAPS